MLTTGRTQKSYDRNGWQLTLKESNKSSLRAHTNMETRHIYIRTDGLTQMETDRLARHALATALYINRLCSAPLPQQEPT